MKITREQMVNAVTGTETRRLGNRVVEVRFFEVSAPAWEFVRRMGHKTVTATAKADGCSGIVRVVGFGRGRRWQGWRDFGAVMTAATRR